MCNCQCWSVQNFYLLCKFSNDLNLNLPLCVPVCPQLYICSINSLGIQILFIFSWTMFNIELQGTGIKHLPSIIISHFLLWNRGDFDWKRDQHLYYSGTVILLIKSKKILFNFNHYRILLQPFLRDTTRTLCPQLLPTNSREMDVKREMEHKQDDQFVAW